MIDIESINLVFNSECIKEYPKVRYILWEFKEKKKSILYSDIEHLKISDEETYTLLRYGFKEIRDLASSEWIQEKYAGEHKSYCELCL